MLTIKNNYYKFKYKNISLGLKKTTILKIKFLYQAIIKFKFKCLAYMSFKIYKRKFNFLSL